MKKFTVIGMGSFGYSLAVELVKSGVEVLVLDVDEEMIDRIKNDVHKAVVADGTDRAVLEVLGLKDMDGVVVSLGQIEASLLATLHLREMKTRRIIAKALSNDHGKILEMIGATDVVFPERDIAVKLARTITHQNIIDNIPVSEGYSILEINPPSSLVGKTFGEINLRKKYGVQVIVIKEALTEKIIPVPSTDYILKDLDVMVVMGRDHDLRKIQNL